MAKRISSQAALAEAQASIDKFMGRGRKAGGCRCKNHLGGPKQLFKTREDALVQVARAHLGRGGTYSVYQCPTTDRFHITSRPKANTP